FFFQAEDGIRDRNVTGVQTCALPILGVVARTSSMLVRHNAKTVREIGQALRVDFILEGSVRREADRVRIAAQLIETQGETQLWEIGRASCRERVEIGGGGGDVKREGK